MKTNLTPSQKQAYQLESNMQRLPAFMAVYGCFAMVVGLCYSNLVIVVLAYFIHLCVCRLISLQGR